nr:TIGR03089 family protein [Zhihengliuella flava]
MAPLRASAAPLLTWHGPSGERVELSGRVVDNWVAKSANLLQEEYDAGPGTMVRLDMEPHWKSIALALAAWHVGATVTTRPDGPADVVVTDSPEGASGDEVLAVALPSLALSFGSDLPAGALDYASEVRSFGDVAFPEPVDAGATALVTPDAELTFGELVQEPTGTFGLAQDAGAVAFATDAQTGAVRNGISTVVHAAVVLFAAQRPLVVLGAGVEASARLLEQERVAEMLGA